MRIPCPYCGERSNDEFWVRGDASPYRGSTSVAGEAEAADRVYFRDNRAGSHAELWYHQGGCRQWLVVTRDTRSHAIVAVAPAGARPVGAGVSDGHAGGDQ